MFKIDSKISRNVAAMADESFVTGTKRKVSQSICCRSCWKSALPQFFIVRYSVIFDFALLYSSNQTFTFLIPYTK